MLFNIVTGYHVTRVSKESILFLVSSVDQVQKLSLDFAITDRHALLAHTQFTSDDVELSSLSWDLWNARDFRYDPEQPDKKERYQAEFLVHRYVPISAINEIACYNSESKQLVHSILERRGDTVPVQIHEDWYF